MSEIYGEKQIDRFRRAAEIERYEHPEMSETEAVNAAYKHMLTDRDYYSKREARYSDNTGIYGAAYVNAMDQAVDRYMEANPGATRITASQDLSRYMHDPENEKISRQEFERRRAAGLIPDRYKADGGDNVMEDPNPVTSDGDHACDCHNPNILKFEITPELRGLVKKLRPIISRLANGLKNQ